MAIKKIKIGTEEHELQTTIANVEGLQAALDAKPDTDTKNTAGSTNSDSKLYLIGATSQAANPQTYSDSEVFTTNGTLQAKNLKTTGYYTVNNRYIMPPVYSYANGTLIKIGTAASSTMVVINVTGNGYGRNPIDTRYTFYDYTSSGGIINASAVQYGSALGKFEDTDTAGTMYVYRYDGNLYAWIIQGRAYQTLAIEILTNKAITPVITNATKHTDGITNEIKIVPQAIPVAQGGTGATTAADALKNFGLTATAAELNLLDGATVTTTEINYLDGVTSNLQTQINNAKAYTDTQIAALVNSAPEALNTLGELATALETHEDAYDALLTTVGNKVDKVSGKGLSTNDYTTAEKNKLAGIATNANNYILPAADGSSLGGVLTGGDVTISGGIITVNDDLLRVGAQFGECGTAAATAAKVVVLDGFTLVKGATIIVKFTQVNTASAPTLNVNSTGAIAIKEYGTTAGDVKNRWKAGGCGMFVYDGTYWLLVAAPVDDNTTYSNLTLGQGYGTCSTAAATAAKAVTMSSYSLTAGGIAVVYFTYAVPANATLNINSKGAKSIYYRNAAITAGVIGAGDTATFMYDGTYYRLLSVDYAPAESQSV